MHRALISRRGRQSRAALVSEAMCSLYELFTSSTVNKSIIFTQYTHALVDDSQAHFSMSTKTYGIYLHLESGLKGHDVLLHS